MTSIPETAFQSSYWECDTGGGIWAPYPWPTSAVIELAFCTKTPHVEYSDRGFRYKVIFDHAKKNKKSKFEPDFAIQMNTQTLTQRPVRRWWSKKHKEDFRQAGKAATEAKFGERWSPWMQADHAWMLVDDVERKAIADGKLPSQEAPTRVPYCLGQSTMFGNDPDGNPWIWPNLFRFWPRRRISCAAHPLGRRCNFALQLLTQSSGDDQARREWSALQKLWKDRGVDGFNLVGAYRVQNMGLMEGFVSTRNAMLARLIGENFVDGRCRRSDLEVLLLFHGTRSVHGLIDICSDGFDRAMAHTCVFGKGCYFANYANLADHYACNVYVPGESTDRRAMLLAAVLVGEKAAGTTNMYPPPVKQHSITGERYENTCDKTCMPSLYVCFKDNQALPCYVLVYERQRARG